MPPDQARRRRGQDLETAILRAAIEEITESGFAALTMDKVAARAGTNKNAIYRRWPNRLALGVAAYGQLTKSVDPPDTGSLRSDALELLTRANRHWSSPLGALLRDLIAAAGGTTELLTHLRDHTTAAATPWLTILARAVARGEASPSALHPRIATVAIDLLRTEFTLRGTPTAPDQVLTEILDLVYLPLVTRPIHTPSTCPPPG